MGIVVRGLLRTLRNMKETSLAVLRVQLVFVLGLGSYYELFFRRTFPFSSPRTNFPFS